MSLQPSSAARQIAWPSVITVISAAISICSALLLPDQTNKDIAHEMNYGNA